MVGRIRLPQSNAGANPGVPVRLASCASSAKRQSIGQAISDGLTTAKVRARLTTSPVTRHYEIHVDTIHATVTLSGYVESDEVRLAALQIACDVDGVQQVKDFLDVHRSARDP